MHDTPETRISLLQAIRDPHDARAWSEFMELYEPIVYRLARGQGLQEADAQDLTQQVMIAVAGRVDRWDPDRTKGSFRGWLFRVSRNLVVNLLIHRRRHPSGTGDSNIQRLLDECPAPRDEETRQFELEYRRQLFRHAAEAIRCEFRDATWRAFWRTCVEQGETKEVAEQLEMTVGAVYIARSRVLARLRQKIEQLEREAS